jgi:hypothetical protein
MAQSYDVLGTGATKSYLKYAVGGRIQLDIISNLD